MCEFCPGSGGGCIVCALITTPQGADPNNCSSADWRTDPRLHARRAAPRQVERVPAVTCDECGRRCTTWNAYGGGVTVLCLECDRPDLSIHEGDCP